MVAGYIVSAKNDGVVAGQLRRRISSFASVNGEEIGHWMESGSLTHDYANAITLLNSLKSGDALYVNDVASLASTFKELVTVLSEAVRRGIRLYGVNDGYTNSKIEVPRLVLTHFRSKRTRLQIFIELPKFADSIEKLREQGNIQEIYTNATGGRFYEKDSVMVS